MCDCRQPSFTLSSDIELHLVYNRLQFNYLQFCINQGNMNVEKEIAKERSNLKSNTKWKKPRMN